MRTHRSWRVVPGGARFERVSPGARFRNALEELGGLYGAFGHFLSWRADLLGTDYLSCLRQMAARTPAIPRVDFLRTLAAELGANGEELGRGLALEPCWSTPWRCAYRATHQGRPVVVQIAREPVPELAFRTFQKGLRLLDEKGTRDAITPEVLRQYQQWAHLADSPERERSFLETLAGMRERTLAEYPMLIPELSAGKVLCWQWIEGEPVSSLISQGSGQAVKKIAEAVLEQICLLSVVDGELNLEALVLTRSGRLGVRRVNRLVAVPAAVVRSALKYVSSALAGNSPVAAHQLLKLAGGHFGPDTESRLLDELAHLQPELKVKLRFPPSATLFEGNWRALSRIGMEKPLFLDCLHRNLVAVGYWNAEISSSGGQPPDCIADAQWPVLSRLVRIRLGELFDRDIAAEWFLGSGLLFLEGLRQLNRLADEFQDNDLSIGVETDGRTEEDARRMNRAIRSGVLTGMLLVAFLVCLRWGATAPAPYSTALAAAALAAAAGLFWTVSRIG